MPPYFRLIESWRPEHSLDGPMTLMEDEGKAPRRICPICELRCRKEEWPTLVWHNMPYQKGNI
eukprot:4078123-Prorocentrum_lima.AAC.1